MTTWDRELRAYRVAQVAGNYSPATIRVRLSYLRRLERAGVPVDATRDELLEWLAHPDHAHWSPETRKVVRGALVSFYGWRVESGRSGASQAANLPKIRIPQRLPRPAPMRALDAGLGCADPDVALMVELAAFAGLRRGEIATLRREALGDDGLTVRGKGGRERFVPVGEGLRGRILARPAGYLFPGAFGGHIHPDTVTANVKAATGVSPHKFRHRFASRGFNGSRNLFAVQQLLGHSSVATTQGYVAISRDALWEVVEAAA